jgi:AraC-like DNA-binding protein
MTLLSIAPGKRYCRNMMPSQKSEYPSHYPLHRFPFVDTREPEEVRRLLVDVFGARYFDLRQDNREFHVAWNFVRLKHVGLGYSHYNSAVSVGVGATGVVRQMFSLTGSSRTAFGSRQFTSDRNRSTLIPASAEARVDRGAGNGELRLRLDAAALQDKLGAMIGAPVSRELEFAVPADGPEMQRLQRILLFLADQLDGAEAKIPDQVLAEYEQLVMVSFLTANRHNYSHLLDRAPRAPGPWQVRLVEEYIEANWRAPLDIETLAAVTGGSTRSIFKAFKEARGVSPMAFVKRVRLENARRELQRLDENTSVIDVASQCGFLNPGHFARDYRTAFGELPSETLRQSRRATKFAPEKPAKRSPLTPVDGRSKGEDPSAFPAAAPRGRKRPNDPLIPSC